MNKTMLNTNQVASLFKVDNSTIRRWCLSGKLSCSSSNGGHRKFAYKDIINFVNQKSKKFSLDLSEIKKKSTQKTVSGTVETISNSALDRNHSVIESTLITKYLAGDAIELIFDKYVDQSLDQIQSMLDDKKISVAEEHIARKAISIALEHFRHAIVEDKRELKKNALCLNLENDIPDISIDMIQIVLEMKNYSVYNSGSNTSTENLKILLDKHNYDDIYIYMCNRQCCTSTVNKHMDNTIADLELVNKLCSDYSIDLYLGGPGTSVIDELISFKYNKFLKFSEL